MTEDEKIEFLNKLQEFISAKKVDDRRANLAQLISWVDNYAMRVSLSLGLETE